MELQKNFPEDFFSLSKLKRQEFFRKLDELLPKFIEYYADKSGWFNLLGEENFKKVKNGVLDHNFRNLDETDPFYYQILSISVFKNNINREIVHYFYNNSGDNLGFNDYEAILIDTSLILTQINDEIYLKWKNEVLNSEAGKTIRKKENKQKGLGAKWVVDNKFDNQYSIIVKLDDKYIQVPYQRFFIYDYLKLNFVFDNIINRLRQLESSNPEVLKLIDYFKAIKKALNCSLDEKEEFWKDVDIKWLRLSEKILPIHPMEFNYTDPACLRVMPEYRIMIEDDKYEKINKMCKETKQAIIRDLKKLYNDKKYLQFSIKAMENTDVRVFVGGPYSGLYLEYKYVGQCIPCREELWPEYGVKVVLQVASKKQRRQQAMKLIKKIISNPKTIDKIESLSAEKMLAIRTAGHEVGHNAFAVSETHEKIGESITPLIEEIKATLTAVALLPYRVENGDLTENILDEIILEIFADSIRCLNTKGESMLEPYYIEALFNLNVLLDSGCLFKDFKGNWDIDLSKRDAFYEFSKDLYDKFVEVYNNFDRWLARDMLENVRKERNEIIDIYNLMTS